VLTLSEALAGVIATASSIVATGYLPQDIEGIFANPPGPRSRFYEQMDDGEMSFKVGNPDTATIHIAVVIDPVSEIAQKWSALAKVGCNFVQH
jgi:UDP-glucose:glycoprotein glucosyltransferase